MLLEDCKLMLTYDATVCIAFSPIVSLSVL